MSEASRSEGVEAAAEEGGRGEGSHRSSSPGGEKRGGSAGRFCFLIEMTWKGGERKRG